MNRCRVLGFFSTLVLLSSLAIQSTNAATSSNFVDAQIAAATAAKNRGDLARALALWRTVLSFDAENQAAKAAVNELEASSTNAAKGAYRRGAAAYKRGDNRSGDRWMLEALALNPSFEQALERLRRSSSDTSHTKQGEKITVAYENLASNAEEEEAASRSFLADMQALYSAGKYRDLLEASEDAPASAATDMKTLVHNSHLALAVQAAKRKDTETQIGHLEDAADTTVKSKASLQAHIKRLGTEVGSQAYKDGLALMKTDLDEAITSLEKAVRYMPDNLSAKEKLDQAQTLQRNLKRIRKN